jgi:hypothetical protein
MLDVDEDGGRSAAAADLFHHLAIGHLRKTAPADFLRRRHPKHAEARETVDHFARDVRLPVNGGGIEVVVEKCSQPRERLA